MFYSLFEKCSVFSDDSIDLQVFKIFEKKIDYDVTWLAM